MIRRVLDRDHTESYAIASEVMYVLKHLAEKYKLNDSVEVQEQYQAIKECEQASVLEMVDKIFKKTHFVEIYTNN